MSETDEPTRERKLGGILLLSLIGLIAIGSILWLVLTLTSSAPATGNAAPAQKTSNAQNASQPPANAQAAQQAAVAAPSAGDALKALEERSKSAGPDERGKVMEEYEAAEKKYSQDYRFSYERARLLVETKAHNEAFRALFIAGEKAIDNGKTVEMLRRLMSDEDGDFKRLSKGHKEWNILLDALKNNDKKALRVVIPF